MTPDEQEALSFAYAVTQKVIRLKSGRFAIFAPYSSRTGHMTLLHIGPWHECEEHVKEFVPPEPPPARALPASIAGLDLELDL